MYLGCKQPFPSQPPQRLTPPPLNPSLDMIRTYSSRKSLPKFDVVRAHSVKRCQCTLDLSQLGERCCGLHGRLRASLARLFRLQVADGHLSTACRLHGSLRDAQLRRKRFNKALKQASGCSGQIGSSGCPACWATDAQVQCCPSSLAPAGKPACPPACCLVDEIIPN